MTGWWFIGSLGEALFFAAVFLIGVFLSAILVSWQLMSQSTQPLKIGYGFWLFLGVCLSFVVMGIVGFWYRVLKVVTSDEHREVLDLKSILPQPLKETQQTKRVLTPPTIPDVKRLTDSPGARLAYRLPSQIPENGALVALGVFAMAWNAMIAVVLPILHSNSGNRFDDRGNPRPTPAPWTGIWSGSRPVRTIGHQENHRAARMPRGEHLSFRYRPADRATNRLQPGNRFAR